MQSEFCMLPSGQRAWECPRLAAGWGSKGCTRICFGDPFGGSYLPLGPFPRNPRPGAAPKAPKLPICAPIWAGSPQPPAPGLRQRAILKSPSQKVPVLDSCDLKALLVIVVSRHQFPCSRLAYSCIVNVERIFLRMTVLGKTVGTSFPVPTADTAN